MARWGWLCQSARLLPTPTVSTARKDINRNKHHFSSFTALNLCSALLCLVFVSSCAFFFLNYHTAAPRHSLHVLVSMCAWPIGCDGIVRESWRWLLHAGGFVCLFYPAIIFYYCLDDERQSVSQSALGAWWSVDSKESCLLNKKLYRFFWSDHCNHLNKSPQECCQLSDSVHSRLIMSKTLCTWKSTQPNNSYLKIKYLRNALFFIVWGWESLSYLPRRKGDHMSLLERDCSLWRLPCTFVCTLPTNI